MATTGWQTLELGTIEPISVAGVSWLPLRRELGVEAFGVNAYVADAGELVVEEHTEQGLRHEEVYLVLRGAATFTLDGEECDAPAGHARPHSPTRMCVAALVATAAGTTVLAVGAPPDEPYRPSAWEWAFAAQRFRPTADHEAALALLAEGLERHPENPSILYEVACWQTMAGRLDEALDALERAVQGDPKCATWAQTDDDLAPLRDLPGFRCSGFSLS